MNILGITFTYPWFLLLLILALALTLIPHFLTPKKYRRNRNKIISLVLHLIVTFLAIFTLSGIKFEYDTKNDHNEIILLVDVSDSIDQKSKDKTDDFVRTVLNYGQYDGYKVGVVTFGFTQVYAVELTTDIKSIYDKYLDAELPDTSASDIASALIYARDLFNYPETSKIVLITDNKETDNNALNVIRGISSSGIRIDTCYIDSNIFKNDAQITDVKLPDGHININEKFDITTTVTSVVSGDYSLILSDNGVEINRLNINIGNEVETYVMSHTLTEKGLHKLDISIESASDQIKQNNEYHTYINLEDFKKVLILESEKNTSETIKRILSGDDPFDIEIRNISEAPLDVNELRNYDQVLLNNVANTDMPSGFSDILYEYVSKYGGGLFTVGGNKTGSGYNAYTRKDMYGTKYQELLPVTAINYTPPVGLMIIIDKSGSMGSKDSNGDILLEAAENGALTCLHSLSERDYVGVMTLESESGLVLPLTPRTQEAKIRSAIISIGDQPNGGTMFTPAIDASTTQLNGRSNIEKRHIIIISDGLPGDPKSDDTGNPLYEDLIETIYNEYGITTSVVLLGASVTSTQAQTMKAATDKGHGNLYALADTNQLANKLREDLTAPEITEVNYTDYNPEVRNQFSAVVENVPTIIKEVPDSETGETIAKKTNFIDVTLSGFYGTKLKDGADLILAGDYGVPVYAQWKYGNGMVGSLMVDLSETGFSTEFVNNELGIKLVNNMVRTLMPNESIRKEDIEINVSGNNYYKQISIYSNINKDEKITGSIKCISKDDSNDVSLIEMHGDNYKDLDYYVIEEIKETNNYSRCRLAIRKGGIYEITLNKVDANGNVIYTTTNYLDFSYSKEYDQTLNISNDEGIAISMALAEKGDGAFIANIDDPVEVFAGFKTTIHHIFDPRYIFMITAVVLFLADIAVRKFKFKWIHELIKKKNQ